MTTHVCGLDAAATGGADDDEDDDASGVFWSVSEMIRRATETSSHQQHVVVEEQPAPVKQQQQELTNSVTVRVPAASRTGRSRLNSSVNVKVNVVDLYSASTRSVSKAFRNSTQCQGRLRNDLYCVEWDVKLYSTIKLSNSYS